MLKKYGLSIKTLNLSGDINNSSFFLACDSPELNNALGRYLKYIYKENKDQPVLITAHAKDDDVLKFIIDIRCGLIKGYNQDISIILLTHNISHTKIMLCSCLKIPFNLNELKDVLDNRKLMQLSGDLVDMLVKEKANILFHSKKLETMRKNTEISEIIEGKDRVISEGIIKEFKEKISEISNINLQHKVIEDFRFLKKCLDEIGKTGKLKDIEGLKKFKEVWMDLEKYYKTGG